MSGVQGIGIAAKNQEGSKQVYILPSHNKKYGHRNLLEGHCSCVFQFKCLQLLRYCLALGSTTKGKVDIPCLALKTGRLANRKSNEM